MACTTNITTHHAALYQRHVARLDGDFRPGAGGKADIGLRQKAHELNAYRIRRFKLDGFVDFSFPPALSTSASPTRTFELPWTSPNASPSGSLYRKHPMFVQIAEGLGIRSILHTDYRSTCAKLAAFGLQNGEQVIHETS
jgi:hypothetical protein